MSTNKLARLITKHKLGRHKAQIMAMAKPGLELVTAPSASLRRGVTKLGGSPDLPAGFKWPRWHSRSLTFIGQINIADIPEKFLWPVRTGLLSFFYDTVDQPWGSPEHRGGARVFYFPGSPSRFRPTPQPDRTIAPTRDGGPLGQCGAEIREVLTIPELRHPATAWIFEIKALRMAYFHLYDEYVNPIQGGCHQFLGWPTVIQNDMAVDCQLGFHEVDWARPGGESVGPRAQWLRSGAARWELLLQVNSDDDLGVCWSDLGMIYFYATVESISSSRFDETWCMLQST